MCDGSYSQLTGCQCSRQPSATAAPLADCVQEAPILPTLPHGASEEGDEVRDACLDVISAVCCLKDIIDVSPDDDDEEHQVTSKFIYVIGAIADLTKAVAAYNEPSDGGEPY